MKHWLGRGPSPTGARSGVVTRRTSKETNRDTQDLDTSFTGSLRRSGTYYRMPTGASRPRSSASP
eukprot:9249079-Pyramimonas_sp.AAC.1